ncbi:MAG TPA: undecaprenyl-diphosphatase UppP [Candidatus Binatus sp.]|uniref:undecaprenyl-diphosphatase UppP n=1 Tax=Candidatus Binatus sp. TaxID=2811406 RepID=UPI002F410569
MFSVFQAIVLGIVQGLTEFLPVSSSAHLILVPWLFKWREDPGLAFDVMLHLGTLLALLVFYWREWLEMVMSIANGNRVQRRLLLLLIVASVPGAIIGVLLEKQAETIFRSPVLVAITLATLGILLWAADKFGAEKRKIGDLTFLDALLIGLSQAFAIIPGVSRSGATITTARFLGVERADAANFSFLMATPIIAGAGLLEVRKFFHSGLTPQLGWGFAASAVFGLLAIVWLLRFVRTNSYRPFAIYRIALAVLVVAVALARA